MSNPEEPVYSVFDYVCPRCGLSYQEANSVRKHPDHQGCPSCGEEEKANIFGVLKALRQNGLDCFLADGPTTQELDVVVKGWG